MKRIFLCLLALCALVLAFWIAPKIGRKSEVQSVVIAPKSPDVPSPADPDHPSTDWQTRVANARKADFPGLMSAALAIADEKLRDAALATLVTRWLDLDATGFTAFLDRADLRSGGDKSIWKLLAPALKQVLPAFKTRTAASPQLKELVRRLVQYSAKTDPAGTEIWVRGWMSGDALYAALATITVEMAKTSPDQALKILATITPPGRRVTAISGLGAVLGSANPDFAVSWATTLTVAAERPYAMAGVLTSIAQKSPQRAARNFDAFQSQISTEYSARTQMDRATNSGTGQETSEGDHESQVSPVNPQLQLLATAGLAIAREWAAKDPAAAMQWVGTMPDGKFKREATQSALDAWTKKNPQQALDYYQRTAGANPEPAENIFKVWASQDPAVAAQKATAVADPSQRNFAVSGVVSGWAAHNPSDPALREWIGKLPAGDSRDVAYGRLVESISTKKPDAAWQDALQIQDTDIRNWAMKSAFTGMIATDPPAARQALQSIETQPHADVASLKKLLEAVSR